MGHVNIIQLLAPEMARYETYHILIDKALNEACATVQPATAEFLLLAGANVNAPVNEMPELREHPRFCCHPNIQWPRTALKAFLQGVPECAFLRGGLGIENVDARRERVIELLLKNGADVNIIAGWDITPLHCAVLCYTEATVRTMIAHGANIHANVPKHGTPLQCAVQREVASLPIFNILLEAGAVIPVEEGRKGPSNPVLDTALAHFGPSAECPSSLDRTELEDRYFSKSSLLQVLDTGSGAVVKLLMQSEPKLLAKDRRFCLLLQMAAAAGDVDYVQLLINRKVNLNSPGHYFGSALQAAARFGHVHCVNRLLDCGAKVNFVGGPHGAALHAAIKGEHLEVVRTLINRGACTDPGFDSLQTEHSSYYGDWVSLVPAIQLAVESGNSTITRLLVDAGALITSESPVLHLAAQAKDMDMVRVLLHARVDVDRHVPEYFPVLIISCGHENTEMVELLLSYGADVNITGIQCGSDNYRRSPLHQACDMGHNDLVRILLKSGADPNKEIEDCVTPLALAVRLGHLGIMEQLLEARATIYDPPRIPNALVGACQAKNPEMLVDLLLQALPDSPTSDSACEEALSAVSAQRDNKIKDIRSHAEQLGEMSASYIALEEAQLEAQLKDDMLPFMLRAHLAWGYRRSPLHQACALGHNDLVQNLLKSGADPNKEIKNGVTPLTLAVRRGHLEIMEQLLKAGAMILYDHPRIPNALVDACQAKNPKMLDLLLQALPNSPTSDFACEEALLAVSARYDDKIKYIRSLAKPLGVSESASYIAFQEARLEAKLKDDKLPFMLRAYLARRKLSS